LPVNLDPILQLATEHGLVVIEDAAEVHGQTYRGRPCGSFGAVSTFSFYPNKHITTGEGGMILTDSDEIAARCRSLRNLCFSPERRFLHYELGWNLRMTNLQAAMGLAQLESLERHCVRKREIGARYQQLLAGLPDVALPLPETDYATNIYWVFGLVLGDSYEFDADVAMRRLADEGVGCRPFFWPMHEQPALHSLGYCRDEPCPTAGRIARRGFYVPSGLGLTDDDINYVASAVRRVLTR
jgi:perosamine synthetase